ncbi:MAG: aldolase/citrate lyase family protein [Alphaproteobacteria bacterium]|nr:aldolase/citrate lyase family protein [Alphaproteobacteria bacterium]
MPITQNIALSRIRQNQISIGIGVQISRGPAIGAIGAAAGFHWLFIDMEHGATSLDQASAISIAALGQGITPIVRVCKDAIFEGTRALDNGAMGVVVPHIDNADEAHVVAQAYRFPPVGQRSFGGPAFAHGFRAPDPATAQREINENVLVCCMIETPEAVKNAAAIAAVPGVDALMIGTSDLTASMGIAGQIGHPDVQAAYATVAAACHAHGKVLGMGGVYDEKWAKAYVDLGARFILGGADHALLLAGAKTRAGFLNGLLS